MIQAGVYYASLTGNNLEIAEFVAQELRQAGVNTHFKELAQVDLSEIQQIDLLIIVPYTYGAGNLPEEGLDLYDEFATGHLPHLVYGIAGSGDVYYGDDFCRAVTLFDERLATAGATRGAPKVFIDLRLDDGDQKRLKVFVNQLLTITKNRLGE